MQRMQSVQASHCIFWGRISGEPHTSWVFPGLILVCLLSTDPNDQLPIPHVEYPHYSRFKSVSQKSNIDARVHLSPRTCSDAPASLEPTLSGWVIVSTLGNRSLLSRKRVSRSQWKSAEVSREWVEEVSRGWWSTTTGRVGRNRISVVLWRDIGDRPGQGGG